MRTGAVLGIPFFTLYECRRSILTPRGQAAASAAEIPKSEGLCFMLHLFGSFRHDVKISASIL
jgi:hypothetical protein